MSPSASITRTGGCPTLCHAQRSRPTAPVRIKSLHPILPAYMSSTCHSCWYSGSSSKYIPFKVRIVSCSAVLFVQHVFLLCIHTSKPKNKINVCRIIYQLQFLTSSIVRVEDYREDVFSQFLRNVGKRLQQCFSSFMVPWTPSSITLLVQRIPLPQTYLMHID
jgi:hypothetical protein